MAGLYAWASRCIPAFSVGLVIALSFLGLFVSPSGEHHNNNYTGEATLSQLILTAYILFLHALSVIYPVRVCWAVRDVVKRMKEAVTEATNAQSGRVPVDKDEKADLKAQCPQFAIILPAYKEQVSTLEETLRVLASHPEAHRSYHLYLAVEEKEENVAFKAASICQTFGDSFLRCTFTVHPSNLPGEAQGKSSNESWAGKQIMKDFPDEHVRRDLIVTTMDADTHLSARYFSQIAHSHNKSPETNQTTIYVPPIVFDRNLHQVPLPVRCADIMWAGAGISSLYTGSQVCIPTSVYSLPMTLLAQVGGWDTGPGAIGEDMHMYLKSFFALSGNLHVEVVYAAASQCDVSTDDVGVKGFITGADARYKQALRHMWGSLDSGYAIRETIKMLHRHRHAGSFVETPSSPVKSSWPTLYTGNAAQKPSVSLREHKVDTTVMPPQKPINWTNMFNLYHRLFEAHFLPTHLYVVLVCSSIYTFFYTSVAIPDMLKIALEVAGWCRLVGFCTMIFFFYNYERYHELCVSLRTEEMRCVGMLEEMANNDGISKKVFQYAGFFEGMIFPISGLVFGGLPATQAIISHLFTERLVYVVSLKPSSLTKARPWKDMSRVTP
ncbi:uncharacterized protein RCC_00375 [Ramularia collo-cygni]|uniref:Glycosyltransferase 2-like domain-containing protein n=1 Tax=Ramularia collo-cygni TaxID=112498 RepID=A0A2D3UMX7_9PEZI|nr:uncharacterized protein RCC_00375 [Ramularia collo-cygni]CZT14398.1 uncharacterized protein RCC_00375 [Ramularia collo-cygni]